MQCPKCEENSLSKIQFRNTKKVAYLCTICQTFWFIDEHIGIANGHLLQEYGYDQQADDAFVYLKEDDKDKQEVVDHRERVAYESL